MQVLPNGKQFRDRAGTMVIEPQKHGDFWCFVLAIGLDSQTHRLRCITCRRVKPIMQFGPFFTKRGQHFAQGRQEVLSASCFICRRLEKDKAISSHPLYNPDDALFFSRRMSTVRCGAEKRKLSFLISYEDVYWRYLSNGCRCELSGVRLKAKTFKGKKNFLAPSVDRIDSTLGYSPDNIQVVSTMVNIMKNEMSMDAFVTWCRRVAVYQDLRTQKLADEIEALEAL